MERLIQRAAMALGIGISVREIAAEMVASGVSAEDAFLAISAARILIR